MIVDPFNYWLTRIIPESSTCERAMLQGGTDHGVDHWMRVMSNGLRLSQATPEADLDVVQVFAAFHDSMRENEFEDPLHGARGFELARKLGAVQYLDHEQERKLLHACVFHDKQICATDPTIAVCWDADRLDLPRVGITPQVEFFSTEAGRNEVLELWLNN